jgi:hypothetical protein
MKRLHAKVKMRSNCRSFYLMTKRGFGKIFSAVFRKNKENMVEGLLNP